MHAHCCVDYLVTLGDAEILIALLHRVGDPATETQTLQEHCVDYLATLEDAGTTFTPCKWAFRGTPNLGG